jgi:hypothetical protein
MVAPESSAHRARRDGSRVNLPLQSQAGTRNFCYGFLGNSTWWTNPSQFQKHGFWGNFHEPYRDLCGNQRYSH